MRHSVMVLITSRLRLRGESLIAQNAKQASRFCTDQVERKSLETKRLKVGGEAGALTEHQVERKTLETKRLKVGGEAGALTEQVLNLANVEHVTHAFAPHVRAAVLRFAACWWRLDVCAPCLLVACERLRSMVSIL
ncbi:hypothetical protein Efla_005462 [Eimeria flavescens]